MIKECQNKQLTENLEKIKHFTKKKRNTAKQQTKYIQFFIRKAKLQSPKQVIVWSSLTQQKLLNHKQPTLYLPTKSIN